MRTNGACPSVLAAAVLLVPAGLAPARPAPFVLGQKAVGTTRSIVRLDPLTLRVEPGPRLAIPALSWSFSPDRSRLAVGADGRSEIRLIDASGPKLIGTVDVGGGSVRATAWLSPRRLLAIARERTGGFSAVQIDALARRVISREPLSGSVLAVSRGDGALAVLLGPSRGIGPSRLTVFLADREPRTVLLPGVRSGNVEAQVPGVRGYPVMARAAVPALAVDPAGQVAAVVAVDMRATTVDLRTMRVAAPGAVRSTSSAAAPLPEGAVLEATWLAGDRVAVWGRASRVSVGAAGELEVHERALGLRVVDLRSGVQRMLEPGATSAELVGGVLLAWSDIRRSGIGLVGLAPAGGRSLHVLGSTPLAEVYDPAGRTAFACCPVGGRSFSVVDLVRRKVVGVRHGDIPQPLTERAAPFSP
jgi:hypothetical protein